MKWNGDKVCVWCRHWEGIEELGAFMTGICRLHDCTTCYIDSCECFNEKEEQSDDE